MDNMAEVPKDKFFVCSALLFGQGKDAAMSQLSNKEGNMKAKKQLIVCLTVCLVVSFVSAEYAAAFELPRASTPVTVVNPNSKPVPVTEVNKYPVQKTLGAQFILPHMIIKDIYGVPNGKRLIIENFSCYSSSGAYSTSYSCFILTHVGSDSVEHFLPTTQYGHSQMFGGIDPAPISNPVAFMAAGAKVQIYADPGTTVLVGTYRQNQAITSVQDYPNESMVFSFSGYLVDYIPESSLPQ